MKQSQARELLGLSNAVAALTPEIVTEAFRAQAKNIHPDSPSRTMQGPAADLSLLTIARKTLLDSLSGADFACKLCGGSGKVRGRMGLVVCGPCKGTGDKR
jgi:DnaJ-class molecular chaperone